MSHVPLNRSSFLPDVVDSPTAPPLRGQGITRQTARALGRLDSATALRAVGAMAESTVQQVKMHEIDILARDAMTGQAMLTRWRDTLAGADPLLADELKFFSDAARIGKGEVLADTIAFFCRESRR